MVSYVLSIVSPSVSNSARLGCPRRHASPMSRVGLGVLKGVMAMLLGKFCSAISGRRVMP